jgi:hypothetical protein
LPGRCTVQHSGNGELISLEEAPDGFLKAFKNARVVRYNTVGLFGNMNALDITKNHSRQVTLSSRPLPKTSHLARLLQSAFAAPGTA